MPAMIFNTIVEGVYLVVVLNSFSELEPSGEIETGIYNVVSFTFFSVFPKLYFICQHLHPLSGEELGRLFCFEGVVFITNVCVLFCSVVHLCNVYSITCRSLKYLYVNLKVSLNCLSAAF